LTKPGTVVKSVVIAVFGTLVVILTLLGTFAWYSDWSVRADRDERVRDLSGDELIPKPTGSVTHAITIRRSSLDVWPWLAQMGSGRAGWYAYDFIDNGGKPSAERILPEFQNVGVGIVFPALPGVKDVFVVARCEPEPNRTRLIVRGRAASGYSAYGLPEWFAKLTASWVHAIMERKQLLGIQRRCEQFHSFPHLGK
jgi:hypothetical protein